MSEEKSYPCTQRNLSTLGVFEEPEDGEIAFKTSKPWSTVYLNRQSVADLADQLSDWLYRTAAEAKA